MRERFKPKLAVPVDFQSFWDKTLSELAKVPSALEQIPQGVPGEENIFHEALSFDSLGKAKISGYRLGWKDEAKRPLVIHAHGYQSQCEVRWDWARKGLNVLGVDIRGFGKSADAVPRLSHWGYILTGRESPEGFILRGAVCDYLRAVQVGRELFQGNIERLVLHGISFAGGLALIAEALAPAADLLVLGVPSFGWVEGRLFFVKSGSGL
ncbi:MAG: acetylxylan esterase, partial [bacterium]|nr:acetylxylan esterase [bacterium]